MWRSADPANVWQMELTATNLSYQKQGGVLQQVIDYIDAMHDKKQRENLFSEKGQPLIGIGATSGMGKSRLLDEIRRHYKGKAHVLVVTYTHK